MTPSVYVIQRSSGQLYCVTRTHYENYPHWYDLVEEKVTVAPERVEEDAVTPIDIQPPVDIEMTVVNKKVQTRTRKPRG